MKYNKFHHLSPSSDDSEEALSSPERAPGIKRRSPKHFKKERNAFPGTMRKLKRLISSEPMLK